MNSIIEAQIDFYEQEEKEYKRLQYYLKNIGISSDFAMAWYEDDSIIVIYTEDFLSSPHTIAK